MDSPRVRVPSTPGMLFKKINMIQINDGRCKSIKKNALIYLFLNETYARVNPKLKLAGREVKGYDHNLRELRSQRL